MEITTLKIFVSLLIFFLIYNTKKKDTKRHLIIGGIFLFSYFYLKDFVINFVSSRIPFPQNSPLFINYLIIGVILIIIVKGLDKIIVRYQYKNVQD